MTVLIAILLLIFWSILQVHAAPLPSSTTPPSTLAPLCMDIQLLPVVKDTSRSLNENYQRTMAARKDVCEGPRGAAGATSCTFSGIEGDSTTYYSYNSKITYKPSNDFCGGSIQGCPFISAYTFTGANYETARKQLCESLSGCYFYNGGTLGSENDWCFPFPPEGRSCTQGDGSTGGIIWSYLPGEDQTKSPPANSAGDRRIACCAEAQACVTIAGECKPYDQFYTNRYLCGTGNDWDQCTSAERGRISDGSGYQCLLVGSVYKWVEYQETICHDSLDNNNNGLIDCADPACIGQLDATGNLCPEPETCRDGIDNDKDLLIDCADQDCDGQPSMSGICETPERNCTDGFDNDGDGTADGSDSDCGGGVPSCVISGAVSSWHFEEGAGTSTRDAAGPNNGLILGADWTEEGSIGWGLFFDGNDFIDVDYDNPSTVDVAGAGMTITAMAKWTEPSGNARDILHIGGISQHYVLSTGFNDAGQDKIAFGLGSGPTISWYYNAGAGLNDGEWHQLAVVKSASGIQMYVDGLPQSYAPGIGAREMDELNKIGGGNYGNFRGTLDEIKIYGRALTALEIQRDQQCSIDTDDDGMSNYLDADDDNDGLEDSAETTTNPLVPDSDGDGMNDGDETAAGRDPAVADTPAGTIPAEDADGDGVEDDNDQCSAARGNPNHPDRPTYILPNENAGCQLGDIDKDGSVNGVDIDEFIRFYNLRNTLTPATSPIHFDTASSVIHGGDIDLFIRNYNNR